MFSYEICEIFKNTYFEEHLQTTAFSSSSFKLDLVDLTVFPDSNLRLAKINKPLTAVCVSKFSRFCSHASSFLRYQAQTFWYYSYENKLIIWWKIVRLIFFEIIQSVPTSKIILILIRIYVRIVNLIGGNQALIVLKILFCCVECKIESKK